MRVLPHADGFSAAIEGVDLTRELPPEAILAIREAWLAHRVVYFPRQPMALADLERLTMQMGGFGVDPYVESLPGHPHVLEIRREPDEKASVFGAAWHSDSTFLSRPPSATLLFGKIVPPAGGETWFADEYAAYDALPAPRQKELEALTGIHSARMPYSPGGFYANEPGERSIRIRPLPSANETTEHPVVRTHPETGRKALFVNPVYTIGIKGWEQEESGALIAELTRHATREEFLYRHRWSADMLAIWDNRCVMHLATGGYQGHKRLMYRTTVAGSRP